MAGKGSKPRPIVVPREEFNKSYENIFGTYIPPYLRNKVEEKQVDDKTKNK